MVIETGPKVGRLANEANALKPAMAQEKSIGEFVADDTRLKALEK